MKLYFDKRYSDKRLRWHPYWQYGAFAKVILILNRNLVKQVFLFFKRIDTTCLPGLPKHCGLTDCSLSLTDRGLILLFPWLTLLVKLCECVLSFLFYSILCLAGNLVSFSLPLFFLTFSFIIAIFFAKFLLMYFIRFVFLPVAGL